MRTPHALRRTIAVTAFVWVLAAGHATAHHDDGGDRPVRDNNTQDYDHNYLTEGGAMACDHGAAQLGRSEISVNVGSNDIHCYNSFDLGGYAGTARCTDTNWWNGLCDHYRVWFNTSGTDTTPDTFLERNYWKALGCHEFGHTGSIGHVPASNGPTGSTCMRSGLETHLYNPTAFTQDDLDHINDAL